MNVSFHITSNNNVLSPNLSTDVSPSFDGQVTLQRDLSLEATRNTDVSGPLDFSLNDQAWSNKRLLIFSRFRLSSG